MVDTNLDALPMGSIIADAELEAVAMRWNGVLTRPWLVVSPNSTGAWFNADHLLSMSDDWTVLRHGPTVADEHTGPDPEVRHYVAAGRDLTAQDVHSAVRSAAWGAEVFAQDVADHLNRIARPGSDDTDLDAHAADARRIVGPEPR